LLELVGAAREDRRLFHVMLENCVSGPLRIPQGTQGCEGGA
jgi:hypothetical protein